MMTSKILAAAPESGLSVCIEARRRLSSLLPVSLPKTTLPADDDIEDVGSSTVRVASRSGLKCAATESSEASNDDIEDVGSSTLSYCCQ